MIKFILNLQQEAHVDRHIIYTLGGGKKKINYRELDWVRIVCRELLERMLRGR